MQSQYVEAWKLSSKLPRGLRHKHCHMVHSKDVCTESESIVNIINDILVNNDIIKLRSIIVNNCQLEMDTELSFASTLVYRCFGGGPLVSVMRFVFLVLFVCAVYPVLLVSLDSLFLFCLTFI